MIAASRVCNEGFLNGHVNHFLLFSFNFLPFYTEIGPRDRQDWTDPE